MAVAVKEPSKRTPNRIALAIVFLPVSVCSVSAPPPRWLVALDLGLCAALVLGGLALVLRLGLGGIYGFVLVMQRGAFSGF